MEKIALIHLSLGPLLLVLGFVFKTFPPKKINHIYGYRTTRSMKSQEVWNEANQYSPKLMIAVGMVTTLVQAIIYFFISLEIGILLAASVMVILLVATIPLTENHLKRNFDSNGNRKQ